MTLRKIIWLTLYELRNQATHGGTLKAKPTKKSVDELLQENSELYVLLMKRLMALRLKPDWKAIELEPTGLFAALDVAARPSRAREPDQGGDCPRFVHPLHRRPWLCARS
jgi:hypothetical protein